VRGLIGKPCRQTDFTPLSWRSQVRKCQHGTALRGRSPAASFDHLVCGGEHRRRHREAEHFGGFQINDQLKFGRLLNRQVTGLLAPEGAVDVGSRTPIKVVIIWIGAGRPMSALGQKRTSQQVSRMSALPPSQSACDMTLICKS